LHTAISLARTSEGHGTKEIQQTEISRAVIIQVNLKAPAALQGLIAWRENHFGLRD
jgi:hypothetical protein